MDKNIIEQAINNIAATSAALETFCNDPRNYNVHTSQLLERMSWELHKQASDLRDINYLYGV